METIVSKGFAFSPKIVYSVGVITGILGFLIIYFFFVFLKKYSESKRVNLSLNYILLLVEIPKYYFSQKQETQQKVSDEINNFENFINTLTNLKYPVIFEIATPFIAEEIFFYLATPRKNAESIKRTIRAFWPGAEVIECTEDYNIFNPGGAVLGSYVGLKSHHFKPLKTYKEIALGNVDTLDSFLGAFNKLKKGEGLAYQIVIKPLSTKENKKMKKVLEGLKKGERFEESLGGISKEIKKALEKKGEEKEKKELKPIDELLIKNIEAKMMKPLFEVNIRILASANNIFDAEEILTSIESSFHQFTNPGINEFYIKRVKGRWLNNLAYEFSFRLFNKNQSIILSSEEIASIFHFPTSYTKSPIIHWLLAKTAPPPVNLPKEGIILGESIYQGQKEIVRIKRNDRRRHIYIIGQTGTGKTTLLKNIAEQDIKNGDGICFIDPHGDVAKELLGLIPKERVDDVIYFNPGDTRRPIGINILEYDKNFPEQKTFIINTLIEIIDKIYNLQLTGGPMFEQYLRNSLLLLMDDPDWGFTLLDVSRVLVDELFRKELLKRCKNYPVVEFWEKQAVVVGGELSLENMITWITSKLNPFITNDFVRPIISQPKTALNFRDIMDNRKIFIVNLSKGIIGETSSYLLGMILIAKILSATFSRVDIPEELRKDFYLFVDEFQNFAFKGVASILSEARKYRLSMVLAHQYIKQLPEEIISAVFGNIGTIMAFRIGPEDAEFLEKQFSPVFSKIDLLNIPNYNLYIKLLIDGYMSEAFNIKTLPPHEPDKELAEKIIELSMLKYGRPLEEINKIIEEKYKDLF
ncbi:MAG: type IV secretory system conjugative DNA transfer family protein [Minisyncoccia bacterium]